MEHTNLIVDLHNVVFTIRRSSLKNPKRNQRKEAFAKELIFKDVVSYIIRFANQNRVSAIAIMGDSVNVWRKDIYPEYKEREIVEDVYFEDCIAAINMIKEFFRECTNSSVYVVPKTEADDLIAYATQISSGVKNIIMSSDRDFVQLINKDTKLYSPPQKVYRESEDVGYDLFLKCIRGDRNDNLLSAYPRARETLLMEAWKDPYKMKEVMETIRKDGQKVGDVYDFNLSMIDLTKQPTHIRQAMEDEFNIEQPNNFSEFKIITYYTQNYLREYSDSLSRMLRPLKGKVKFTSTK